MIVDVIMPKMGESIVEGTILEWKVKVGDMIKQDETLLDISTDKVDSEIPSPATGTVIEILFAPLEIVEVGVVIARIGTENEAVSSVPKASPEPENKSTVVRSKIEPRRNDSSPKAQPQTTRFYSPLVKAIAAKEGLAQDELDAIPGSGSNGRVTKKDILAYLEQRGSVETAPIAQAAKAVDLPPVAPIVDLADEIIPMTRIRQMIASHMRQSLDISTHVYAVSEADMTAAVAVRKSHGEAFLKKEGVKLTYTPMIAYATLKAIRDFPLMNATLDGNNIVKKRHINLGMAVALPDNELIVPVVHKADEVNFIGLSRRLQELALRAREGTLKPEEASGSTFTITNPGIFGSLVGFPIINQPNVGILAVGTIKKRPVVLETEAGDSIIIRSMMMLSLGHDHRLIDGAYGAQFLERVVYHLQNTNWADLT